MIGTRQTEPFYLESPSGEFFTSPFLLAFASVPSKLPPPGKSLIGEKSPSGHLIGARWYDPELAIFMSADPAGQYSNPYSYGPSSPMNGTDPTGMIWNPFSWFTSDSPGTGGAHDFTSTQGAVKAYVENPEVRASINTYMYMQSVVAAEVAYWSVWYWSDCITCAQAAKSTISSTGKKYFVDNNVHRRAEAGPFTWDFEEGEFHADNPMDLFSDNVSGGKKLEIIGNYAALATDVFHGYQKLTAPTNPSPPTTNTPAQAGQEKSKTYHGNFLGPGNKGMDKACIDVPDCGAKIHDVGYNIFRANGPPDAVLNPHVGPSDLLLAAMGLAGYVTGVGNQTETTGFWGVGVATTFGAFSTYKLAYIGTLYQDAYHAPSDIRKISKRKVRSN